MHKPQKQYNLTGGQSPSHKHTASPTHTQSLSSLRHSCTIFNQHYCVAKYRYGCWTQRSELQYCQCYSCQNRGFSARLSSAFNHCLRLITPAQKCTLCTGNITVNIWQMGLLSRYIAPWWERYHVCLQHMCPLATSFVTYMSLCGFGWRHVELKATMCPVALSSVPALQIFYIFRFSLMLGIMYGKNKQDLNSKTESTLVDRISFIYKNCSSTRTR